MWGLITGFLGKFSIKQYIYGAIAVGAIYLATSIYGDVKAHLVEHNNLKEANVELNAQNTALRASEESKQRQIDSLHQVIETQAEAVNIVNTELSEARDERDRQIRVLEGSRLARLAAERASLIENRSNAATEERLSAIEELINEDF